MQDTSERDSENPWYTNAQVRAFGDGKNDRGLRCNKCGDLIPQFSDLPRTQEDRILSLIRAGRHHMAVQELRAATGCSIGWAKSWVTHKGRPDVIYGVPCRFCGNELRSSDAKQCRHCKRDWHDPLNILLLGTDRPWTEE